MARQLYCKVLWVVIKTVKALYTHRPFTIHVVVVVSVWVSLAVISDIELALFVNSCWTVLFYENLNRFKILPLTLLQYCTFTCPSPPVGLYRRAWIRLSGISTCHLICSTYSFEASREEGSRNDFGQRTRTTWTKQKILVSELVLVWIQFRALSFWQVLQLKVTQSTLHISED